MGLVGSFLVFPMNWSIDAFPHCISVHITKYCMKFIINKIYWVFRIDVTKLRWITMCNPLFSINHSSSSRWSLWKFVMGWKRDICLEVFVSLGKFQFSYCFNICGFVLFYSRAEKKWMLKCGNRVTWEALIWALFGPLALSQVLALCPVQFTGEKKFMVTDFSLTLYHPFNKQIGLFSLFLVGSLLGVLRLDHIYCSPDADRPMDCCLYAPLRPFGLTLFWALVMALGFPIIWWFLSSL